MDSFSHITRSIIRDTWASLLKTGWLDAFMSLWIPQSSCELLQDEHVLQSSGTSPGCGSYFVWRGFLVQNPELENKNNPKHPGSPFLITVDYLSKWNLESILMWPYGGRILPVLNSMTWDGIAQLSKHLPSFICQSRPYNLIPSICCEGLTCITRTCTTSILNHIGDWSRW